MVSPAALDARFAAWLAAHEQSTPDAGALADFVAAWPQAAQRRAARVYAQGFLRGCTFCEVTERAQRDSDLDAVEARLVAAVAFVRLLRAAGHPPESTT